MDLSCFYEPTFNQKQWINNALDSAAREQNVDRKASDLALELHVQMKDAMQTIDRSIQEAIHSIPRVLREVESLRIDAVALGSELRTTQESLGQVHEDSQSTTSKLIELDRSRRNAQCAANALRETARWSELVREVDEVLESKDFNQLCANIESMEHCLSALTHLPDYNDRLALVETHKNSLETLLAPQLIQAFNQMQMDRASGLIGQTGSSADGRTQFTRDIRHLIDLFHRMGRIEAAVKYFNSWLNSQVRQCWEQSVSADCQINRRTPVSETMEQLLASIAPVDASEFGPRLKGADVNKDLKCRQFAVFVARLVYMFEYQLKACLFSAEHQLCVVRGFATAISALRDQITEFVSGSTGIGTVTPAVYRVDVVTSLFRIMESGYSIMINYLEACPDPSDPHTNQSLTADQVNMQVACEDLARAMTTPFKSIGDIFSSQVHACLMEQVDSMQWTWTNPTDQADILSNVLCQSTQLLTQASSFCLDETRGICLPALLEIIQNYWDAMATKWLSAIDQSGTQLVAKDADTTYNQANLFSAALQLASITGELSVRSDLLVDGLLIKSADALSGLFSQEYDGLLSGSNRNALSINCYLRQLVSMQSAKYQQALRCLAHSSPETAVNPAGSPVPSHSHDSQCTLTAVHRANVNLCRAAVTMVRRVALAPMRRILQSVPRLASWSAKPSSGECTLPNLAYLPQDYMTQIGQYLLALPESFEPYMGANIPLSQSSSGIPADSAEDLVSNRGLVECLRLGDPEAFSVTMSNRMVESGDDSALQSSKGSTQRKRLTSLSHLSGGRKPTASAGTGENPDSAALCWLETLISGVACDLLVGSLLNIATQSARSRSSSRTRVSSSSKPNHKPAGRDPVPDSGDESEDAAVLTEHGAKQLEVDLDYFRNLLDDLGLPLTGSLKALCELLQCPVSEFASLSASRPPRIANAVARLRGI